MTFCHKEKYLLAKVNKTNTFSVAVVKTSKNPAWSKHVEHSTEQTSTLKRLFWFLRLTFILPSLYFAVTENFTNGEIFPLFYYSSDYFAVNEISLTAKYFLHSIILSDYFAVNEISLTAKYSLDSIILSDYFAVNDISLTAKYFLYSIILVI